MFYVSHMIHSTDTDYQHNNAIEWYANLRALITKDSFEALRKKTNLNQFCESQILTDFIANVRR